MRGLKICIVIAGKPMPTSDHMSKVTVKN